MEIPEKSMMADNYRRILEKSEFYSEFPELEIPPRKK